MDTLLKTAAKEAAKKIRSAIFEAVEDIVNQAVNIGAADRAISLSLDRLTESKEFAKKLVTVQRRHQHLRLLILG